MAEKSRLILLAADESEHSTKALNWYAEEVHRPGYNVLVVTVMEFPQLYVSENMDTWETVLEEQAKTNEAMGKRFVEALAAKGVTDVKTKVIQGGSPGECIVEEAEKSGAMMVVMGTRGMGTIRRTIMGSVSDYVVHHAHCPVLICRH